MIDAVQFEDMRSERLEDLLDRAPEYERFAPAAKRAIRVIHGLPSLFRGRSLDEIELYVGRTACDPRSLRGRWRCHENGRDHRFGVVLFVCPTDRVQIWERAANRLVKRLEKRRALCVANALAGGPGPLPNWKFSCIYLTWRFRRPRVCEPVSRADLETLLQEVYVSGADEPSLDSWRRAIAPLPSTRDRMRLRWAGA
jgi:hypothetical protein